MEDTVKQLEQKLADKLANEQTDTQSSKNSTAQLEQKLTDKNIISQTGKQPLKITTTQLKHTPESHKNTSQNISETGKPENTEKLSGLVLFDVGFSLGKSVINDATTKIIQQSTQYILSLPPNYRVIVEGHTDNIPVLKTSGKKRYKDNIGLSLFRAKEVANIFKKEGISSKRISAIGYGATRPIASNNTVEGRAKNRRVVVRLIPE